MTNLSEEKLQMINGGYSNLGRSTMGLFNIKANNKAV